MTVAEILDELSFVMQQRDKPTVVLLATADKEKQMALMDSFSLITEGKPTARLDVAPLSCLKLLEVIKDAAATCLIDCAPGQGFLHITGLDRDTAPRVEILQMLNFDREHLFRMFPFNLIFWVDLAFADDLARNAQDLCDWITYKYRVE